MQILQEHKIYVFSFSQEIGIYIAPPSKARYRFALSHCIAIARIILTYFF